MADARNPLAELVLAVEIAKALDRRDAGVVPRVDATPVEADDGDIVGGGLGERRHARPRALRLVDRDVGEPRAAKRVERARAAALGEPARLPELDRDLRAGEAGRERFQVRV